MSISLGWCSEASMFCCSLVLGRRSSSRYLSPQPRVTLCTFIFMLSEAYLQGWFRDGTAGCASKCKCGWLDLSLPCGRNTCVTTAWRHSRWVLMHRSYCKWRFSKYLWIFWKPVDITQGKLQTPRVGDRELERYQQCRERRFDDVVLVRVQGCLLSSSFNPSPHLNIFIIGFRGIRTF